MMIDRYGKAAENEWFKTGEIRNKIKLHEFIIMPNNMYGIIEIVNCHDVNCRGTSHRTPGLIG